MQYLFSLQYHHVRQEIFMQRFLTHVVACSALLLIGCAAQGQTFTFRQDVSGYIGTQDTELRSNTTTPQGSITEITVDQSDAGEMTQGLLRFDDVFGSGAGQIPINADNVIFSATLTLNQSNPTPGTVSFHRMLTDWDEATATWNTFGGDGVQQNDVESASAADGTVPNASSNGLKALDVTAALQSWYANPNTNLGWVFVNTSTDGWDFSSSENATIDLRPQLQVVVAPVPGPGALPLFGAGLTALGLVLRRRLSDQAP
jgi:hypothetical protein